jgi:transcriptional regulator NrdR family protein
MKEDGDVRCPACGADSRVVDSRPKGPTVWRRRECVMCRRRFTTREVIDYFREGKAA